MVPVSIVIITKNEDEHIAACLKMSRLITDDIIIVDNGSTDKTLHVAAQAGCSIHQSNWDGYGANKNKGIALARYDWILSIDADEIPDMELVNSIHNLHLRDAHIIYDIKFSSYFGKKRIRFGSWGRDHHARLFNRKQVKWTEPKVHETLIQARHIRKKKLEGHIHHYSVKDNSECTVKAIHYARLSAEKYFLSGKRANFVNLYLSPVFVFIKSYILFLGFLDGIEGWYISKSTFKNRWIKYHLLSQMELDYKKKPVIKSSFAIDC